MAAPLVVTPLFQGVNKSSAGYKLLESMGWKEGDGLGAKLQGIKEHVKVKKKHDAMGVGANETSATNQKEWTSGMVSFDRILANLKEVSAARPAAADSDSSSSDEEEAAATKKAAKKGKGKKADAKKGKKADKGSKRKRASPSSSGSEASSSSSDDSDDSGGAGAKRLRVVSHVGRYHKRERAKSAKNYSASDLEAILGGVAAARDEEDEEERVSALPEGMGFMTIIGEVRAAPREDDDSSSSGDEEAEEQKAGPSSAAAAPAKKASRPKEKQPSQPPVEEWEPGKKPWWAGMFVRAGRMGSIRQELRGKHESGKAKIQITGFREQDQENLYEQAQEGAAHGRQGLGRSDMPKKVAGARWCGTKTKIGDDGEAEEEEEPEEASGSGSGSESEDEGRIVVKMSKKEQAEAAAVEGRNDGAAAAGEKGKDAAAVAASAGGGEEGKRKRKAEEAEAKLEAGEAKGKATKKGKEGKKAKKGNAEALAAEAPASPSGAADGGKGKEKVPKWRKLVQQLLADAPERRWKLKKLKKELAASHGLSSKKASGGGAGGEEVCGLEAVLEQLRGSKKFRVCDKFVTLT